jgi:uncharacterized membrane protein
MNLPHDAFSPTTAVLAAALLAFALAWSWRRAPWVWLRDSRHLNALCGAVLVLVLAWHMRASAGPGLDMHLLGATLLTLIAGPRLALLSLTAVLVATTLNGDASWTQFGPNALVTVLVPIGASAAVLSITERYLPTHLFVYIFVAGFVGAGVSLLVSGLAASALLLLSGSFPVDVVAYQYAPYFLLLAFSEAWLTGIVVTALVVYRPEWVATYDDARYLTGK